ncbi:MAG: secretin N-terminal domain-containing protein [Candidatus Omnitrophica bacterium]|nr:secretin N-terminal domain-containing protein [Candidatus Omnitrophota bacterium]MDD5770986.1 secretin N-terminal domain-containing protein [Candidatus Omnitrophota bacterium]
MKKILLTLVFISSILCVFFVPPLGAQVQDLSPGAEPFISLDFQDVSIKDVLKMLSMQSGMNFIASEAVADRRLTLYLDKVPLSQAMDKIFSANNLSYEMDPKANIFIVKDWGKMEIETITKVFYLKHATVSSSSLKTEASGNTGTEESEGGGGSSTGKWKSEEESGITYSVKKLLSGNGSLVEDYRTNSLIVTDTPARMKVISQVIASLDIEIPQIMLEVEMLDVSKNAIDKLGAKFGQSPFTAYLFGASAATGFPFGSWSKVLDAAKGSLNINPGSVDDDGTVNGNPYQVQVDFLKTQADTRVLARPRIMTLNNETAEIKITTDEVIGETTDTEGQGTASSTTTSAERVETGVLLRVTPQINSDNGDITMFIYPSVRDAATSSFNSDYKDPEERSTKTTVKIKDGETVVIGGLIRHDKSETMTKLPILGDIPLVGVLFRHKDKDRDRERELLVFITPRIIKDNQLKLEQMQRFSLPIREQSPIGHVNRDYLINSSLNNFDKKR